MKNLFRLLITYFLRGVLFIVPGAATAYVIIELFLYIDGLLPYPVPGLGLLTLIATITLFGVFASTIFARPIQYYGKRLLNKVPFVKTLYTSIKDLLAAFVGKQKKFDQPVLVRLHENSQTEKLGFLTHEDLSVLGIENGKVAVYLPHSYAFSGNLFIVPAKNVTLLNARATDVMKFIISGGITHVTEEEGPNEKLY